MGIYTRLDFAMQKLGAGISHHPFIFHHRLLVVILSVITWIAAFTFGCIWVFTGTVNPWWNLIALSEFTMVFWFLTYIISISKEFTGATLEIHLYHNKVHERDPLLDRYHTIQD